MSEEHLYNLLPPEPGGSVVWIVLDCGVKPSRTLKANRQAAFLLFLFDLKLLEKLRTCTRMQAVDVRLMFLPSRHGYASTKQFVSPECANFWISQCQVLRLPVIT